MEVDRIVAVPADGDSSDEALMVRSTLRWAVFTPRLMSVMNAPSTRRQSARSMALRTGARAHGSLVHPQIERMVLADEGLSRGRSRQRATRFFRPVEQIVLKAETVHLDSRQDGGAFRLFRSSRASVAASLRVSGSLGFTF